jgi:hypothetical protein
MQQAHACTTLPVRGAARPLAAHMGLGLGRLEPGPAIPPLCAQAEWAFALREADESYARHAVIPRLGLAAAGGRCAVARDVLVVRVDSLEDTPVAQAVIIRDWSFEE